MMIIEQVKEISCVMPALSPSPSSSSSASSPFPSLSLAAAFDDVESLDYSFSDEEEGEDQDQQSKNNNRISSSSFYFCCCDDEPSSSNSETTTTTTTTETTTTTTATTTMMTNEIVISTTTTNTDTTGKRKPKRKRRRKPIEFPCVDEEFHIAHRRRRRHRHRHRHRGLQDVAIAKDDGEENDTTTTRLLSLTPPPSPPVESGSTKLGVGQQQQQLNMILMSLCDGGSIDFSDTNLEDDIVSTTRNDDDYCDYFSRNYSSPLSSVSSSERDDLCFVAQQQQQGQPSQQDETATTVTTAASQEISCRTAIRKRYFNSIQKRIIPDRASKILDFIPPDYDGSKMISHHDNHNMDLVSWNQYTNVLAIIVGNNSGDVYLWNSSTEMTQQLTSFHRMYATSVEWCGGDNNKHLLAVGTSNDVVQLWDTESMILIRIFHGHKGHVTALSWQNEYCFSSGGQDSLIFQHDIRSPSHFIQTSSGHNNQEICCLQWNDDGTVLASGGGDNLVCIWDIASASTSSSRSRTTTKYATSGRYSYLSSACNVRPRLCINNAHEGGVKALDWCPHRRGLLATGGGGGGFSALEQSTSSVIKLWDTSNSSDRIIPLTCADTNSHEVSSLQWSYHRMELCSGHGHQLVLWEYDDCGNLDEDGSSPSLSKVKELRGYTGRVSSLACSPDGNTVVSASTGDGSLRFWDIFGSSSAAAAKVR